MCRTRTADCVMLKVMPSRWDSVKDICFDLQTDDGRTSFLTHARGFKIPMNFRISLVILSTPLRRVPFKGVLKGSSGEGGG